MAASLDLVLCERNLNKGVKTLIFSTNLGFVFICENRSSGLKCALKISLLWKHRSRGDNPKAEHKMLKELEPSAEELRALRANFPGPVRLSVSVCL